MAKFIEPMLQEATSADTSTAPACSSSSIVRGRVASLAGRSMTWLPAILPMGLRPWPVKVTSFRGFPCPVSHQLPQGSWAQ